MSGRPPAWLLSHLARGRDRLLRHQLLGGRAPGTQSQLHRRPYRPYRLHRPVHRPTLQTPDGTALMLISPAGCEQGARAGSHRAVKIEPTSAFTTGWGAGGALTGTGRSPGRGWRSCNRARWRLRRSSRPGRGRGGVGLVAQITQQRKVAGSWSPRPVHADAPARIKPRPTCRPLSVQSGCMVFASRCQNVAKM